jgi:hypothetical protein
VPDHAKSPEKTHNMKQTHPTPFQIPFVPHQVATTTTTTVGRPIHAQPTWFVIFAESEVSTLHSLSSTRCATDTPILCRPVPQHVQKNKKHP